MHEKPIVYEAENSKYRLRILYDAHPENPREWDNLGVMVCGHRRYKLGDKQAKNTELYNNWDEWLENEILAPNGGADKVVFLPLYLYDHSGITISTSSFSCPWDSGQVGWIYCTKQRFQEETGYSEDELFSTDPHREPKLKEHVRIKGKNKYGWGQVVNKSDGAVTVDFDYCRPSIRKPENTIIVQLSEIKEVMANRAKEMLQNEVNEYDCFLRGDVYGFTLDEKAYCDKCGHTKYEPIDSGYGFYGEWAKAGIADNLNPEARMLLESKKA